VSNQSQAETEPSKRSALAELVRAHLHLVHPPQAHAGFPLGEVGCAGVERCFALGQRRL
jgi:hypothetical protein